MPTDAETIEALRKRLQYRGWLLLSVLQVCKEEQMGRVLNDHQLRQHIQNELEEPF